MEPRRARASRVVETQHAVRNARDLVPLDVRENDLKDVQHEIRADIGKLI